MTRPIWDKGAGDVDERIMRFLAGDDVVLDRELFLYDIRASRAHVGGLERIDVLTAEEAGQLMSALDALAEAFSAGDFTLDDRFEDGHSAIEAWLIERLGDVGKKVHTGRSRNDQVLVATRLWLRDQLGALRRGCARAAEVALSRAGQGEATPMPGYTHLQPAVASTLQMWFAGWAEAWIDDATMVSAVASWVDANPLGTAAGYGVNLPLDREGVGEELGFRRAQINPIYAQNSRGKFELAALDALGQALLDVRRFAWDLSLFTTREFRFADLPDRFMTGSSIMPNKRNPDVVELLRAAYGVVAGARAEMAAVLSLPSGYHRDLQATKGPLLRAFGRGVDAVTLAGEVLEAVEFDEARMREAIDADMYATDRAVELTSRGVPFREAYRQVAGELDELRGREPEASVQARVSPGACARLGLDVLASRLAALR